MNIYLVFINGRAYSSNAFFFVDRYVISPIKSEWSIVHFFTFKIRRPRECHISNASITILGYFILFFWVWIKLLIRFGCRTLQIPDINNSIKCVNDHWNSDGLFYLLQGCPWALLGIDTHKFLMHLECRTSSIWTFDERMHTVYSL